MLYNKKYYLQTACKNEDWKEYFVMNTTIRFPYLGLEFHPGQTFNLFGISVAYYGICIGLAMFTGAFIVYYIAHRTKQNVEDYLDFTILAIIFSIIGARLYYCIFNWELYADNPVKIITGIREGGLAIYGGIIAAVITLIVFCRIRRCSFWIMADTACAGLCLGQAVGRWGNFFNREAFGGYTDSIFAMQIPTAQAHGVTRELLLNARIYNGESYIQVHPTFLYESIWNIALFAIILFVIKHKKFRGQAFATYLFGYGLGRTWIELLRTDSLLIPGTTIPVSVIVSVAAMAFAAVYVCYRLFWDRNGLLPEDPKVPADGSRPSRRILRHKKDVTAGCSVIEEVVEEESDNKK